MRKYDKGSHKRTLKVNVLSRVHIMTMERVYHIWRVCRSCEELLRELRIDELGPQSNPLM